MSDERKRYMSYAVEYARRLIGQGVPKETAIKLAAAWLGPRGGYGLEFVSLTPGQAARAYDYPTTETVEKVRIIGI